MNRDPSSRRVLGDPSKSTGYVLLSGLAWGFVVTTFESLSQPPLDLGLFDYLGFYARILVHFCAGGILIALLTARISDLDRGLLKWIAIGPAIAVATAAALMIDWLSVTYVPIWRNNPMSAMWQLSDVASYAGWIFTVYGGLYIAAFLFLRKEAVTRERLRLAELARIGADARMERALTEQTLPAVAPDLLLRALSELARRYDEDDRRADRLLDKLVKLLRSASGAALKLEPGREPDVAVKLAQLCRELELPANVQFSTVSVT
jgi:hypothetical protein